MTAERPPEDSGGTYNPDAQLVIGPDGKVTEILDFSPTTIAVGTAREDTDTPKINTN